MLANGEHDQAELTALLGLAAVDQASIDEGRWGTAWFLTMLPEPPWRLVSRPSSSMEAQQPFSRMLEPRLMAALTGHLKDLSTLDELKKKHGAPRKAAGKRGGKGKGDDAAKEE